MQAKIEVGGKTINLAIDDRKKFNYIYGFNGSGKTSISRYLATQGKDFFVFNEDYVYENIYNVQGVDIKNSASHNQNLAEVFITKECRELTGKIEQISLWQSEIKDFQSINIERIISSNPQKFNPKYKKKIIEESSNILSKYLILEREILKSKNNKIKSSDVNFIIENLDKKNFVRKNIQESFLNEVYLNKIEPKYQEKKLEEDYFALENGKQIENFNYMVKNSTHNSILKDILDSIRQYNESLGTIEKYNSAIKRIEETFKKLDIAEEYYQDPNNDLFKWVACGIGLHKMHGIEDKFCLFCGNEKLGLSEWSKKIEVVLRNKISSISKEIKLKIEEFERDNFKKNLGLPIYKNLLNHFENIKNLNECLSFVRKNDWFKKNILGEIKKQKPVDLEKVNQFFEKLVIQEIELAKFDKDNFYNYAISELFFELKNNLLNAIVSKLLDRANTVIKKCRSKLMQHISEKIQSLLSQLNEMQINPFSFKVSLFNPPGSSKNKEVQLKIEDLNGNPLVGRLSTGQRNGLALMLFVAQAKEKIDNKDIKWVVFDDPVDGGDFYSYFLIKSFIMQYFSEQNVKVIILTHNFDYLLIQLNKLDTTVHKDDFEIRRVLDDGNLSLIKFDDLYSSNKAIYFKLTKYLVDNFKEKCDFCSQPFVASWIIWTRKIVEEFLIENLKLDTGERVPTENHFKFILERINGLSGDNKCEVRRFLTKHYKGFLGGKQGHKGKKVPYDLMIESCKKTIALIFGDSKYLCNFYSWVNNIKSGLPGEFFNKEEFKKTELNDDDFAINMAHDAAKVMLFAEEEPKQKIDNVKRDISNYLKHGGYSISKPVIALPMSFNLN